MALLLGNVFISVVIKVENAVSYTLLDLAAPVHRNVVSLYTLRLSRYGIQEAVEDDLIGALSDELMKPLWQVSGSVGK